MNVYFGKPVIFEPGRNSLTLHDAVQFCDENSPNDGWFVRVTGNIETFPNCLVPSSRDALTGENYSSRPARKRAKGRVMRGLELQCS